MAVDNANPGYGVDEQAGFRQGAIALVSKRIFEVISNNLETCTMSAFTSWEGR